MSFPSLPNPFSSSSSSSSSSPNHISLTPISSTESTEIKNEIIQAIQTESATANAKSLIQKVNETCFTHCVSNPPSTSLSRSESSCLSACMEKYLEAWNVTSRTYIKRISLEAPRIQDAMVSVGGGGAGAGGISGSASGGMMNGSMGGGGKEMF